MLLKCVSCKKDSEHKLENETIEIDGIKIDIVYFECSECGEKYIATISPTNLLNIYYRIQRLECKIDEADRYTVSGDEKLERELRLKKVEFRKLLKGTKKVLSGAIKF